MQQEELSGLFTRNLILDSKKELGVESHPDGHPNPVDGSVRVEKPITYISQHYHHSSHLAQRPTPGEKDQPSEASDIQAVFLKHNIDPSALSPPQLKLFNEVDDQRKLRLLELWRVASPSHGGNELDRQSGGWYRGWMRESQDNHHLGTGLVCQPDQASTQPQMSLEHVTTHTEIGCGAEPHELSGYELLMRRDYENQSNLLRESHNKYNQAVDPVFQGPGLWEKNYVDDAENRYMFGMSEQINGSDIGIEGSASAPELEDDMVM